MNRMDRVFEQLRQLDRKILTLYFPIGDPILKDDCAWAERYFENGCTVLEIGLPNDDPVLDGKTVADSMARALANTGLEEVFRRIKRIRARCPDQVLQIMVYAHVIENMGLEAFAAACHECDVDGVLSPNIPPDRVAAVDAALEQYNIYNLRFSPYYVTYSALKDLKANARGYIFQQAVDGATGPQSTVSSQIGKNVRLLKESGIKTPVLAGFGISNASQVKQALSMGADGVIVGSATISHIIQGDGEAFIRSLYEATAGGQP